MNNIISALNVFDVGSPKLRFGSNQDGGYVINQAIADATTRLISLGMGYEDSFERDWLKRGPATLIEAYDGSVVCQALCSEFPEEVSRTIFYVNRHVGYAVDQIPLNVIVGGKSGALLKVDIEGAEYHIFDNVRLDNVAGLLLEVHDLDMPHNQEKLISLIQNQFRDLVLFHVHGNSWGHDFTLSAEGQEFPNFPVVLELSFIHKDLADGSHLDDASYPIPDIDYSNNPSVPDLDLYWINKL